MEALGKFKSALSVPQELFSPNMQRQIIAVIIIWSFPEKDLPNVRRKFPSLWCHSRFSSRFSKSHPGMDGLSPFSFHGCVFPFISLASGFPSPPRHHPVPPTEIRGKISYRFSEVSPTKSSSDQEREIRIKARVTFISSPRCEMILT